VKVKVKGGSLAVQKFAGEVDWRREMEGEVQSTSPLVHLERTEAVFCYALLHHRAHNTITLSSITINRRGSR